MNANPLTQNLSGFGFPSENSINKDLTATQQVASPKCPSDTSLNPDIKSNFSPRLEETSEGRTSIPPTNELAGILEVIL